MKRTLRTYHDMRREVARNFFRDKPIPFTGNKSKHKYLFRYMRTKQEMAENDFLRHDEDAQYYGIRVRGKRRRSNLPDAWDDDVRSNRYNNKSWKEYRKTQYKT